MKYKFDGPFSGYYSICTTEKYPIAFKVPRDLPEKLILAFLIGNYEEFKKDHPEYN